VSQHSKQEVNWEFLLGSSKSTLQAFEQSRLNFAANVRKEIGQLLDTWVDESSSALLARWLIERNLAAEATAICANPANSASASSEPTDQRAQAPRVPGGGPKPPCRMVPPAGVATHSESDKISGKNSIASMRISASS
jgi:hypothetical protein